MSAAKYFVGQRLIRRDVNGKHLATDLVRVEVTKVGRKLVTIEGPHGVTETYRMETGVRNDDYGHTWVLTEEEHQERLDQREALDRLSLLGVRFDHGSKKLSAGVLNRFADMLRECVTEVRG